MSVVKRVPTADRGVSLDPTALRLWKGFVPPFGRAIIVRHAPNDLASGAAVLGEMSSRIGPQHTKPFECLRAIGSAARSHQQRPPGLPTRPEVIA